MGAPETFVPGSTIERIDLIFGLISAKVLGLNLRKFSIFAATSMSAFSVVVIPDQSILPDLITLSRPKAAIFLSSWSLKALSVSKLSLILR